MHMDKAMRPVNFFKLNPSGNTTLFLEAEAAAPDIAFLCGLALRNINAEQAAMINLAQHYVHMGGGEFCANACRAFGALLALRECPENRHYQTCMRISGANEEIRLDITGALPEWRVAATFSLGQNFASKNLKAGSLISMPGITHLLLESDALPENASAMSMGKTLRQELGLEISEACGIVWWKHNHGIFEIKPLVWVRDTNTEVLESSCGSASIAMCLLSGQGNIKVRQPAGEILEVTLKDNGDITLSGNVAMLAQGQIWLPAPSGSKHSPSDPENLAPVQ